VIAIIPTADRQSATVDVRVGFDELDPRILPDMGIKVAFQGVDAEDDGAGSVVVVPRAAIRSDGGTDIVLVLSGGTVERRAVRVGQTTPDGTTVLAGVAGGERVVVEGPADLADGDEVEERS
jgi:multidrug efflux pump subunit AcrA (membrane-fusion protein)